MTNAQEFVVHRLKETHDIVHVLTGFGIDGASELGLQGFNLAQNRSPLQEWRQELKLNVN